MLLRAALIGIVLALPCLDRSLQAQTAYTMVMSISPAAAQLGTTSEHTINSRYSMEGAYQVLVSGSGVRGRVVPPKEPAKGDNKAKPAANGTLTVEFQVDPDALPGVRDVRIATPHGVSTVGQMVLVADPIINEKSPNDKPEAAQEFAVPATVCGRIEKAEDVDFFRFHADAGAQLCFHVMCMRLQDRVHDLQQHADPILTIRDANGSIVASSDNEFSADPLVCHSFAREGEYVMEIRDVRYQGNQYWEYCVEINSRPLVTTVYPLGIAPGQVSSLELLGFAIPQNSKVDFKPSAELAMGLQPIALRVGPSQLQEQRIVVADQPITAEAAEKNDSVEAAQNVAVPGGINGRIEAEGDVDCYRFEAKKGERYSFEVFARRAGSSLDPHLRILDEKGNQLQLNDDMRLGKRSNADSLVENWTVPADGRYIIEVRDLHLRGGASFAYFIQATQSLPSFALYADTDKTPIAPGTTGVVYVRAEKKNGFDGEIELAVSGLPPGVKAHCGRILAGKAQDGCIVFEVAENVEPEVANIVITGSAANPAAKDASDEKSGKLVATASIYQEIYQPGGGRGHWPVDSHTVAVTAPSDIRNVKLSTHEIKLKAGQSATIDVELERAEGFDKNVTLETTYSHLNTIYGNSLPEGVTLDAKASNTLLTGGATKGKIVLKAAANAPAVERQQSVLMANVSLNFVMKATYGSQPIFITVEK
ncbi:MAG: PPC domain-containing protein [Aureliella sp.]